MLVFARKSRLWEVTGSGYSGRGLLRIALFFRIFVSLFYLFVFEREKERETEIPSRLLAVSAEPDVGLDLTNHEIMT